MENEVMVVSKDAFKIKALDHYAPELVSGWWMDKALFTQEKGDAMQKVHLRPNLYCRITSHRIQFFLGAT